MRKLSILAFVAVAVTGCGHIPYDDSEFLTTYVGDTKMNVSVLRTGPNEFELAASVNTDGQFLRRINPVMDAQRAKLAAESVMIDKCKTGFIPEQTFFMPQAAGMPGFHMQYKCVPSKTSPVAAANSGGSPINVTVNPVFNPVIQVHNHPGSMDAPPALPGSGTASVPVARPAGSVEGAPPQ